MTSINKIRGNFDAGALSNRFHVNIYGPNKDFSVEGIRCESVSLPTKSLASNSHDIYGPPREIPYRTTFTEAAMSFILDDFMDVKTYFDEWQSYIINDRTGNPRYWDNFTGTIKIHRLLNESQTVTDTAYKVELQEAYYSPKEAQIKYDLIKK